ncbi:hypothetical protein DFH28DRAFT_1112866 [Melampsora americana]|nr:hypothetical protein DFH28DRAFT_1112866 [Melampsora americana]
MVNRKLSNVPFAASGRTNVMSRAIRTRSYQATLAEGMGSKGMPGDGRSTAPIALPASTPPAYSPLTSTAILTPSLNPILCGSPTGAVAPTSSQLSSGSLFQNHIHPMIFDSPSISLSGRSASPSTLASSGSRYHNTSSHVSPLKRSATEIELAHQGERYNETDDDLPVTLFDNRATSVASQPTPAPTPPPKLPLSLSFLADEEQTLDIYFNIWQAQVVDQPTNKGKKMRTTPGGS